MCQKTGKTKKKWLAGIYRRPEMKYTVNKIYITFHCGRNECNVVSTVVEVKKSMKKL